MKSIVVITRALNEFNTFWGLEGNEIQPFPDNEQSVILIKKNRNLDFSSYAETIGKQFSNSLPDEIGIMFHSINDEETENILKNALPPVIKANLKFCKWYSSTLAGFWDEQNVNADLPYNNFKKAWKDSIGNKEATFKTVWNYFDGNSVLEAKLELLHNCMAFTTAPNLDPLLTAKHKDHYDDFLAAVKDSKTDGTVVSHINALIKLRVDLLGS